jgi:outer membrane protein OmpA-like peptidoglycan-associated protein
VKCQLAELFIVVPVVCAAALTSCSPGGGGPADASAGPAATGGLWAPAVSLDQRTVEACRKLWAVPNTAAPAEQRVVVVVDRTAGTADQPLPEELRKDLSDASAAGGSLTVIGVEGSGTSPHILVKDASLSPPGARDRQSVRDAAAAMPDCVATELLQEDPTAPGSDLYAALASASEILIPGNKLWILSDFQANTGQINLDQDLLWLEPTTAANTVAATAPLDLHGAHLFQAGLANGAVPLDPASRKWMESFAQGICSHFNATGCGNVHRSPVNAGRSGTEKLPEDRALPFPKPTKQTTANGCAFNVPGVLTFEENSAELLPGAEQTLSGPIALALTPRAKVHITGHTASVPDADPDTLIAFSKLRADATKGLFRKAGVPEDRITIEGVGDTRPLQEDIDPTTGHQIPAAAARERRVEITIEGAPC